jgi:tetratricopeptide (TPR) repeat protein
MPARLASRLAASLLAVVLVATLSALALASSARAQRFAEAGTPLATVDSLRDAGAFVAARDTLEALRTRRGDTAPVLWRLAVTRVDLGERAEDDERAESLYRQGLGTARAAVEADDQSALAHLAVAIAAGRVSEVVGTRERVELSRTVKAEAKRALALDATLDGAHHVLGRWHYEVADLGFFERTVVKAVYGGLPDASFEQAAEHFLDAIRQEQAVRHFFHLGRTYLKMDREDKARAALEEALALPNEDPDDPELKRKARRLLDDLA